LSSAQTAHSWAITGATKSGTFQLTLTGQGMSTPITLAVSKLLSSRLADEARFQIDGNEATNSEVLYLRDATHTISLTPNSDSPLAGLEVSLQWVRGSGVVAEDLTCTPTWSLETTRYSWLVKGSANKSGTFELRLVGKGMDVPLALPISRQIHAKYFIDDEEVFGSQSIVRGREYSMRVEVSSGVSKIYIENSPGEFDFRPPLGRQFDSLSGTVRLDVIANVERVVQETVFFKYSLTPLVEDRITLLAIS